MLLPDTTNQDVVTKSERKGVDLDRRKRIPGWGLQKGGAPNRGNQGRTRKEQLFLGTTMGGRWQALRE